MSLPSRGLPHRLTDTLPELPRNVNPVHVEDSKIALKRFLQKKHGDDTAGKRATVQRLVEQFKNGNTPNDMDMADKVALVLVQLELKEV